AGHAPALHDALPISPRRCATCITAVSGCCDASRGGQPGMMAGREHLPMGSNIEKMAGENRFIYAQRREIARFGTEQYRATGSKGDRKSTRLNSSHVK